MKTAITTLLALIAFAGNSVLCRLALGENSIDASSFTWVRLLTGAIVLIIILAITHPKKDNPNKGSWLASFMLFTYAICFSFAYISLDTGVGALILFGAVQITIIAVGILKGNRLYLVEWVGAIVAFLGFIYLVLPGLSAPPLFGFMLMSAAGIAWGFYTLAGKGSQSPLSDTTYNFIRTLPFIAVLAAASIYSSNLTQQGILLAIVSGGLTSGVGYTIWYIALRGLANIQAAVVQLLVPVLAAIGGVVFAAEDISARLIVASVLILGGILTVILGRYLFERGK